MTAVGTRPIMFHNVRLASPMDPIAKQIKQITSKRIKTDEDRLDIARLEFEGGLYHDATLGPYMPGIYMFRSLLNAARITRDGKKVERGLVVGSFMMPLVYKGPRDIEGLWGNGESKYVDMRTVVVNRQKVDRCRPIFDEWTVECEMTIDPTILDPEDLIRIAENAGALEGVGDYRLMYGRFAPTLTMDAAPKRPKRSSS